MFLENKYTALYFKLTSKSDTTNYTENHHIIPRCMGGDDSPKNLVRISARKHFLCHYLLIKMVKCKSNVFYKLIKAFGMMHCQSPDHRGERYLNSRLYENHRKDFAKAMSITQSGNNNSQFGTTWIYCPFTLISKKVPKNQLQNFIDRGCVKGRVMNPSTHGKNKTERINNKQNELSERRKKEQERYHFLFTMYKNSGLSYEKFIKKYNLPHTYSGLCHIFRQRGFIVPRSKR